MNSSPLGSALFIAGSLLLPPAVAGPTVGDTLATTDGLSVDVIPGSGDMLRRAMHAAASHEACTASGAFPGVRLALRVVAEQFGAPVAQLLDEYQAYRSSWQGRD